MAVIRHTEKHFRSSETVRDVVIGMADGLTVPFALAAGLSAIASTRVVVAAGMAEIAAGAIAMGLGGYLAAKTDMQHYASEEKREYHEIEEMRDHELEECEEIFRHYGLEGETLKSVVTAISSDGKRWVDFMMRFELGLEKHDPKRASASALTIGASYIAGGAIPLAPYLFNTEMSVALPWSVGMTAIALLIFGGIKGQLTGANVASSAAQTLFVGGIAAGAAFYLASLFA